MVSFIMLPCKIYAIKYFQPHGGEHGYPDPNYLKNLREDLNVRGITEAAILEHLNNHPKLRNNGRM